MAKKKVAGPSTLIKSRISRFRRAMKRHGVGAYLITKPWDYYHLTGFTGEDSAVLVMPKEMHVISDGRFDEALNQECPWMTRWMRKGLINEQIAKTCKALQIKKLAVQSDSLTIADHDELKKRIKSTRLVGGPPIGSDMRILKDGDELARMKKAIRNAEDAFRATCTTIKPGQTEIDVAARLEFEMKKRGASGPSFPTISAVGANAALPHAHPGRRKIKKGSALLLDWGSRVDQYCSDLTRVVFLGSIPRKIGEVYRIVLEAQERAIEAIRPGRRMCDIDAIARNLIADAGFGTAFNHGLGHGLGLDVHEAPSLSWRSDQKLVAGMVVTVEPGIYLPGLGGVRIEDDVLVTPKGHRVLSRLSKTLDGAVI